MVPNERKKDEKNSCDATSPIASMESHPAIRTDYAISKGMVEAPKPLFKRPMIEQGHEEASRVDEPEPALVHEKNCRRGQHGQRGPEREVHADAESISGLRLDDWKHGRFAAFCS
jgi:hypothetical protein